MILFFKVRTFCGLAQESCVVKQILKDDSCMLPCEGLIAGIKDDSVQEGVI